ncbi:MAG: inorganic phosphate transporter [Anaerolineae bacterium]
MIIDVPVVLLVSIALAYTFLNGIHDSSNIVATMISSRAMGPRKALMLTAVAEFMGPFLLGVAVAKAIGSEIVVQEMVDYYSILAGTVAAILWNLFTWATGIPSSSSHALIGGLIGAVMMVYGRDAIIVSGLWKVIGGLFLAPPAGLIGGYIVMKIILFLARGASPKINILFKRGQLITSFGLALSHGANDAQKAVAIIIMGMMTLGRFESFYVPRWTILLCATGLAVGTAVGGWRIIRTIGGRFYKIRPIHGFTTQITSAGIIALASVVGSPVSTTQVVSSSILGIGSAQRISQVRWKVAQEIMIAWLLTIPITGGLAALLRFALPYLWR